MFAPRLFAGLAVVALFLAAPATAPAQDQIPRWRYVIQVEVTHFSGTTYWSFGYETTDYGEALWMWNWFQDAFESGELQDYYGSRTAFVSDIRFRRVSNIPRADFNVYGSTLSW